LLYEQGKISQIQNEESQDFFRRNLVDFYQRVKILEKMLIMVILERIFGYEFNLYPSDNL